jgi:hypothetical protein
VSGSFAAWDGTTERDSAATAQTTGR